MLQCLGASVLMSATSKILMVESRGRYMGIHCKILSTFVYVWKFEKSELSKITQLVMMETGF